MKNQIFVIILVVFTIFLTACSNTAKEGSVQCDSPYIVVGTDCCLDKNNNRICDKEEVFVGKVSLLNGPSVNENCNGPTNLDCIDYTIGAEAIRLKLQSVTKDFIKVKKIEFKGLSCSMEFSNAIEMRFNDVQDFEIPCAQKYNTIDTNAIFTLEVRSVKVKSSGEVYDISPPNEMLSSGHLSGKVVI